MAAECPVLDMVDHAGAGSDDNGRIGHVAGAPFDERGGLPGAVQPVRITTVDYAPDMTRCPAISVMRAARLWQMSRVRGIA